MRILTYAISGIILGFGFPILCNYIEFGLKKSIELVLYVVGKLI